MAVHRRRRGGGGGTGPGGCRFINGIWLKQGGGAAPIGPVGLSKGGVQVISADLYRWLGARATLWCIARGDSVWADLPTVIKFRNVRVLWWRRGAMFDFRMSFSTPSGARGRDFRKFTAKQTKKKRLFPTGVGLGALLEGLGTHTDAQTPHSHERPRARAVACTFHKQQQALGQHSLQWGAVDLPVVRGCAACTLREAAHNRSIRQPKQTR